MPADITLTGNLNGLSTVGGNLGPASFNYALNAASKFHAQEIDVPVPGSTPVVYTMPGITSQTLFYLKTTQDVVLTINAEPSGTLKAGGLYVRTGMPDVTSVTLDGNGATPGIVYIVIVGS
ncbi:MAG: hypothetical protein AB7L09_01215 [Nitrospira sp.]